MEISTLYKLQQIQTVFYFFYNNNFNNSNNNNDVDEAGSMLHKHW